MARRFKGVPEPEPGPPAIIDVPGAPEPCPECGADLGEHRRHELRRVPNPEGGRGAITARVAICGACDTILGPA